MDKKQIMAEIAKLIPDNVTIPLQKNKKQTGSYGRLVLTNDARLPFTGLFADGKTAQAEGRFEVTLVFGQATAPGKYAPASGSKGVSSADWAAKFTA